ncbi:ROK family protein [Cryptosporangium sp. NPDC048952]|uniref:ROK family protein n=1 Tax=Cryptosporangium sp. NPDC048952 TaxID=3363961 RepID=UPI00371615BD
MSVLAVDLGGTSLKTAVIDATGAPLWVGRHPTGRERGPSAVVSTVLEVLESMRDRAVALGSAPQAIGLAVPGLVDAAAGVALWSVNVGWRDLPLRSLVEERLGLPAVLANDVRAGGLAEARASGSDDVLFVPIGTGIASAHVLGGSVVTGSRGAAGELGHVVVRPGGRRCGCGRFGCLEAEASASAIESHYREALAAGAPAAGAPAAGASAAGASAAVGATAADVARMVEAGDAVASAVWGAAVEALADGLASAAALLDPQVVVVGGGLAQAGDTLFTPLRAALEERASFLQAPTIVPAALGDEAGCHGAALLAREQLLGPTTTSRPNTRPT